MLQRIGHQDSIANIWCDFHAPSHSGLISFSDLVERHPVHVWSSLQARSAHSILSLHWLQVPSYWSCLHKYRPTEIFVLKRKYRPLSLHWDWIDSLQVPDHPGPTPFDHQISCHILVLSKGERAIMTKRARRWNCFNFWGLMETFHVHVYSAYSMMRTVWGYYLDVALHLRDKRAISDGQNHGSR